MPWGAAAAACRCRSSPISSSIRARPASIATTRASATVAADLRRTAALGDATKKIYELPVMKSLPKGVRVSPSGDAKASPNCRKALPPRSPPGDDGLCGAGAAVRHLPAADHDPVLRCRSTATQIAADAVDRQREQDLDRLQEGAETAAPAPHKTIINPAVIACKAFRQFGEAFGVAEGLP